MRKALAMKTAWIIGGLLFCQCLLASPEPISILSPDGTLAFRLEPGSEDLVFTILSRDKPLVLPSPLRFLLDSALITGNVRVKDIKKYSIHERYPWLGAHSTAVNECNGAEIQLLHDNLAFTLDIRVLNN